MTSPTPPSERSPETANVAVRITVRDSPDWHVYKAAEAACVYAVESGVGASLGVAPNKYAVHIARNAATASLPPSATHLFFVDNDVHVQQDAILRLLEVPADIAVGCYAQLTRGTAVDPYICVKHNGAVMKQAWNGVLRNVEWAGSGCMMIRREVFDALEFPWWTWPLELEDGKVKEVSDDVEFCRRAREAGFTIAAHGNVFCSHSKMIDSAALFVPGWTGPKTVEEQASNAAV